MNIIFHKSLSLVFKENNFLLWSRNGILLLLTNHHRFLSRNRSGASNCEIIWSNGDLVDQYSIFKDFKRVAKEDLNILGASVIEDKAVDSALRAKITDLERSIERLSNFHAHDALCLLKNSLAIPKLQYILRNSPCAGNSRLSTFDKVLRCGLSKILNVNLNDTQWTQATLPVYVGGLGVRIACMLATSAFLASAVATFSLQEAIPPDQVRSIDDLSVSITLSVWKTLTSDGQPYDNTSRRLGIHQ